MFVTSFNILWNSALPSLIRVADGRKSSTPKTFLTKSTPYFPWSVSNLKLKKKKKMVPFNFIQ
jgi:hypothetical protein